MQDCTLICDWSRELALSSHPIRSKTETNGDLDTHVSPAFNSLFVCLFLIALSLAVKQRSWVQIPYRPQYFLALFSLLSSVHN